MKYKCVISDLDLTLLGPNSILSPANEYALKTIMKAGIEFVPASGRAFNSYPENIRGMKGIRYAITSNGVSIYELKDNKAIYTTLVKETLADELINLLSGYNVTFEGFIDGKAYTGKDYYNDVTIYGASPVIDEYVKSTRTPVDDIKAFIQEHNSELECIDVILGADLKDEVYKLINDSIADIYVTTSAPHLIEISNPESGKHSAMKRTADILGISPEEIIAFGDGDNDSEMLKTAGLGIAMGNASFKCKESADIISIDNDKDAVAKELYRIFSEIF